MRFFILLHKFLVFNSMKNILHLELNTENRIFGLDLIRAIAILFVMILHAGNFLPFPQKYHHYYINIIYDGVGIFFVLSGFLIGSILIREIENTPYFSFKNLINFLAKRWSRTLPNYYLFAFILMLIYSTPFTDIVKHLLFIQNIHHKPNSDISWSWSLSVEEWFYLLIPFLIFIMISILKIPTKTAFLGVIFIFLASIGFLRYFVYFNQNLIGNYEDIRHSVIYRIDGIMYGVLGAFFYYYYKEFWIKHKWLFCLIGCIGILSHYLSISGNSNFYQWVIYFPLTSISVLCFLPILSLYKTEKNKIFRNTTTFISLISYSLYIINMPVSDALEEIMLYNRDYIDKNLSWSVIKLIGHFLFWSVSILLATLIYKYYEVPTIRYFRKKLK